VVCSLGCHQLNTSVATEAPNIALQQTGSLVAYLAPTHPTTRNVRTKPALRAGRPRC